MLSLSIQHQKRNSVFSLNIKAEIPLSAGIVGIFGDSGSGKSSLLDCLSGIAEYQGNISYESNKWDDLPPFQRPLAYQQQQSPLLPNLSVEQNLQLPLTHGNGNLSFTFEQVVDWCDLGKMLKRTPQGLSGGERQRVAFARTLLAGKSLILLDEPFSALDWPRRAAKLRLLKQLHQQQGIHFILVSHSLKELQLCCDHILHLQEGRLQEQNDAAILIPKLQQWIDSV